MTVGLVSLLFIGYTVWGTSHRFTQGQQELGRQLDRMWALPEPPSAGRFPSRSTPMSGPVPGRASRPASAPGAISTEESRPRPSVPFAKLRIPSLGLNLVVVEGVSLADLRKGVGHYPRTPLPWNSGNVGLAGHRVPSVFWTIDRLGLSDLIILETRWHVFRYSVTGRQVVRPTNTSVLQTSTDPGSNAPQNMLTLTTCHPRLYNYQRLIVQAVLTSAELKPVRGGDTRGPAR